MENASWIEEKITEIIKQPIDKTIFTNPPKSALLTIGIRIKISKIIYTIQIVSFIYLFNSPLFSKYL